MPDVTSSPDWPFPEISPKTASAVLSVDVLLYIVKINRVIRIKEVGNKNDLTLLTENLLISIQ
jgi:hypothetical protein